MKNQYAFLFTCMITKLSLYCCLLDVIITGNNKSITGNYYKVIVITY